MAGYSKTPLPQKLGIKPGFKVMVVGGPKQYQDLVKPWPSQAQVVKTARTANVVHVFWTRQSELKKLVQLKSIIFPAGSLWVSWPKKSSGVPTDLDENRIRKAALAAGLVDVKVCAVDDTWSGLKLVVPVAQR